MERLLDTEEIIERLPYSASPQEIRFQVDILAIQSIAHSLPLFATELAVRHLNRYLRHIVPVVLALTLTSCVAPSLTIYGRGVKTDRQGNRSECAVKEAQIYGDLVGNTVVQGSIVTVRSNGGYYNSTVVRETGKLIGITGRSIVQPIAWGILTGGVMGDVISTAGNEVPKAFGQ